MIFFNVSGARESLPLATFVVKESRTLRSIDATFFETFKHTLKQLLYKNNIFFNTISYSFYQDFIVINTKN